MYFYFINLDVNVEHCTRVNYINNKKIEQERQIINHRVTLSYQLIWDAYISSDNKIKTGTISNLAVTPTGYRKQFLDHIKQVD